MQYFFVQNTAAGTQRDIKTRQFADLEAAQRSAVCSVRELVSDALLLGRPPGAITIEIWAESGGVVSVVQCNEPE